MTADEILLLEQSYSESKIQHTCVCWFRTTFPHLGNLLYAIPNGGYRTPKGGAMLRYEGALSGVADLCLAYPYNGKGALYVEMKVPKRKGSSAGKQSDNQKSWQEAVTKYGNEYKICRGLVEFIGIVCEYLCVDKSELVEEACDQYPIYL